MAREDILTALKNALERGATTSLINAGYNRVEIEEASRQIGTIKKKGEGIPLPPRKI